MPGNEVFERDRDRLVETALAVPRTGGTGSAPAFPPNACTNLQRAEEMLIDNVISSWLFLTYVNRDRAATYAVMGLSQGPAMGMIEGMDRRVERASKQYAQAIRDLLVVRRLLGGGPLIAFNSLTVRLAPARGRW